MKRKRDKQLPGDALTDEDKLAADGARKLFTILRNEAMLPSDREELWNDISATIDRRKQRTFNTTWMAVAASVTLFLLAGVGYIVFHKDPARIMQEAASRVLADSGDTQLVLGGQRLINLRQDNANLVYGKDGSSIQIDSTSVVEQEVSADQQFNTLIVPYGKRSSLTLSDGTRIWLNSGSKLVYPAKFPGSEREVYLEGQAYFSVSHSDDVPFYVHTREMKVKVLGTEFDVSAYEDDHFTSAVLASGSIELSIPQQSLFGAKKTKITPGTRAVFQSDKSALRTEQVDVSEFISWKDGYLILEKAPLGDILKKLSRYYRVDITLKEEELEKVTFSGTLHLQDDIEQVLDIVATTTSLNYKQQSKERRYLLEKSAIRP